MLLPYRTTTPLYYFPWCTLALIGVNATVFALEAAVFPEEAILGLALRHGQGLHPLEWLTSNFVHASPVHLVGNMVFLWVFGQITEGRLGWRRFLLVYLGIGIVQCAGEQIALLGAQGGGSYGSSTIIYGLMAMSVLWAPEEEIYIWYWFGLFFGTFLLRVKTLAFIYVLEQGFLAWAMASIGEPLSSAILHLSGAALGLVPGILFLKKGWMEIDGKDIFTGYGVPNGPREVTVESEVEVSSPPRTDPVTERRLRAIEDLRGHLRLGDAEAAIALYHETAGDGGPWHLPEAELRGIIRALSAAKRWDDLKPLLVEYARRYPETSGPMRLLLARIHLEVEGRPHRAIQVIDSIPARLLPGSLWEARGKLLQRAREARP